MFLCFKIVVFQSHRQRKLCFRDTIYQPQGNDEYCRVTVCTVRHLSPAIPETTQRSFAEQGTVAFCRTKYAR